MQKPFVTIVCPVRNAERTMDTTFQYLLNVDYPRDKMEIVLADGGSTDKTIEIIKKWQAKYDFIKLVEVPNSKSPGHARNEALKVAKGEYILFTDADCAPRKDWIDKMLEPFFMDPQIGMVGGEIYTLRTDKNNVVEAYCEQAMFLTVSGRCGLKNDKAGYYPTIKKDLPSEVNGSQTSPFFATANAAISRKAGEAIGNKFWDFITSEDVDFSLRILKAGFKLYYQPSAIVDHMHRATLKQYHKQLWGYGYGHPLGVREHAKNYLEFFIHYFNISIPISFPIKGIIYIGDFHLLHLFGLSFIGYWIWLASKGACPLMTGHITSTFAILGGGFLFFLLKYFGPLLKFKPLSKFFHYCWIKYSTNWALMKGGFKGWKEFGVIYIEQSF